MTVELPSQPKEAHVLQVPFSELMIQIIKMKLRTVIAVVIRITVGILTKKDEIMVTILRMRIMVIITIKNNCDDNHSRNHSLGGFTNSSSWKNRASLQVMACLLGLAARPFNQGPQDQYHYWYICILFTTMLVILRFLSLLLL